MVQSVKILDESDSGETGREVAILLDIIGFHLTMECNKEEAIRAKEIAEKKMQSGDFEGALRIALKAKKLYPDLDNISQVLMVCEVHCSAQNKLNGSEMDWYGILQIEKFSDEPIVKKQFRKLALSLHPDKNKFAGAEAAFKLIGEANRVLTDPTKRSSYDMKCRVALRSVAPKSASDQSNKNSYVKKQHGAANNFSNAPHSQFTSSHTCQQPQQTTFWTHCPSCSVKYQYYREFLNKMLRCQNCQQPFIANDLGMSSRSSWSQFINEKRDPNQGPSEVAPQNDARKPSVMNFVRRFSESDTMPKVGKSADVCGSSKPKEAKAGNASGIGGGSKPQEKVNGHVEVGKGGAPVSMSNAMKFKGSLTSDSASSKKRRKSVEKSSENFDKGSSAGIEENIVVEENGGDLSAQNSRPSDGYQPRRSSRQKQHISYEENLSNDDFVDPPPKRSRGSRSSGVADGEIKEASAGSGIPRGDISAGFATYALNRNNKEVNQKATSSLDERSSNKKRKMGDFEAKGDEASMSEKAGTKLGINDENSKIGTSKLNSNETLKSEIFVCPDPNFNGMPRFYARVKKVLTPGFKLQITWLEASPDNDAEQLWCEEGLPSACGMYENGDTVETVDHPMFSHQMCCKNAGRRGTYLIYPMKGETWALFKDWDIKWSSEPDKHRPPYQFEFVEILTNFTEDLGIGVSYLDKVKGFVSIYQKANCNGVPSFYIRPSELYRFSHRIPSCRMTVGKEKLDAEAIGSHSKSCEHEVQPIKGSEKVCTPKNLKSGPQMGISALSISSGESTGTCKDDDQIDVDQRAKNEDCNKVARHGRLTQPEGISTSFQATEKSGSPKKREKFASYALTPRRSPRDLSNRVDASQSTTEVAGNHTATNKDERQGQPGASSRHPDNKMHLHVKDGSSVSPAKSQKSSGCRVIEVEHYDFKKEKSEDKFQLDQIWAMHSNKDGYPGIMLSQNKPVVLPVTAFSHQVKAKSIGKNRYEIYPRQGEIWAIYKIRNSDLMFSDQDAGECDIVEVVKDDENGVKVVVLMRVNGSESFYMAPRRLKSGIINITRAEFGRFSHQCLASQAMGKKSLRGYLSLLLHQFLVL
ncbi:hypothetical protein GH714_003323 [Hevea brasiliensis]|uniref:J domain-containing protein n=1 Tax=Hevea brasiliensis TaxID=3981 RepID=A0A6A6KIP1_HEVBR|nr:hypothetical protein GH714_003323 [Hevea brasiliensis]